MAKAKKTVPAPNKNPPDASENAWKIAIHVMIGVCFLCTLGSLVRLCQLYVDQDLAQPIHPKVVLQNRPNWMSDALAQQITKSAEPIGLHSSFDHQLLVDTTNALQANPWVRKVNYVRRAFSELPGDTLEVNCDFRAPIALVQWGQYFWLVDSQAFALPEQYTADQLSQILFDDSGRVSLRIITGVNHAPPEVGQIWPGDDLAGGLELAKLISSHDWAEEIRQIDVGNFGGRKDKRDAQLVLITQYQTQIRWGRAPNAKDAFVEPSPSVKLAALQNIYEQKHRVDANQPWIDLRFDQVMGPKPVVAQPPASAHGKTTDAHSASADSRSAPIDLHPASNDARSAPINPRSASIIDR